MKVSVSSYSFNKLLSAGEMTQLDCISKAKELGFDAIEFAEIKPDDGISQEDYAKRLADECKKVGLPVSSFAFGADFLKGSGGDTDAETEKAMRMIDIAQILGAPLIRHDATAGDGRPFDAIVPIIAGSCRRITEYAASKGIKTTVENHGFFCQDSDRMEKLYNAIASPNFGLLLDMGNFLCADEAPEKAFGRLAPFAFHAHAKDFHVKTASHTDPGEGFFCSRGGNYLRGSIIGHGDVPIISCLKALKRVNYNGFIAIEFEGMEDNIKALEIGLSNLRKYINIA